MVFQSVDPSVQVVTVFPSFFFLIRWYYLCTSAWLKNGNNQLLRSCTRATFETSQFDRRTTHSLYGKQTVSRFAAIHPTISPFA
jgi:hypothetical protein